MPYDYLFNIVKFILLTLSTCLSLAASSQATYLRANLFEFQVGMFSVFSYIAGVLHEYETHNYAGIEVDFEKLGLYYDPKYGPNWWEYYCEPIRLGNKENASVKEFNASEYVTYAYFTQRQLNRHQVNFLIRKYIKIRENIQNKIDQFIHQNFTGSVIGVHYRGTDKITEVRRVSFEEVLVCLHKYIAEHNLHNYKIFVASDEMQFIEFIQRSFKDAVISYSTLRSDDEKSLHFKLSNNYLHGEEAFIDCILLSRCNFLIRTSSNLSLWSTYFNPEIPVIELSSRY